MMTKNRMAVVRIVDDNDEYRNSEAFMLRMFGYNVVEYVSALSFLEEDNPAIPGCVILDNKYIIRTIKEKILLSSSVAKTREELQGAEWQECY